MNALGIVGIIGLLLAVAIGSAVGLTMVAKTQTVFTGINSYTTGNAPYSNPFIVASHTVTATGLLAMNETHAATVGTSGAGQCYNNTLPYPIFITSVKFYLNQTGNPDGNMQAGIYNTTGTYGTNMKPDVGELGTSDLLGNGNITGTLIAWQFNFTTPVEIAPSETYAVMVFVESETTMADAKPVKAAYSAGHAGNRFAWTDDDYVTATTDTLCIVNAEVSLEDLSAYKAYLASENTLNVVYASWPLLGLVVLAIIGATILAAVLLLR